MDYIVKSGLLGTDFKYSRYAAAHACTAVDGAKQAFTVRRMLADDGMHMKLPVAGSMLLQDGAE